MLYLKNLCPFLQGTQLSKILMTLSKENHLIPATQLLTAET